METRMKTKESWIMSITNFKIWNTSWFIVIVFWNSLYLYWVLLLPCFINIVLTGFDMSITKSHYANLIFTLFLFIGRTTTKHCSCYNQMYCTSSQTWESIDSVRKFLTKDKDSTLYMPGVWRWDQMERSCIPAVLCIFYLYCVLQWMLIALLIFAMPSATLFQIIYMSA